MNSQTTIITQNIDTFFGCADKYIVGWFLKKKKSPLAIYLCEMIEKERKIKKREYELHSINIGFIWSVFVCLSDRFEFIPSV